MVLRESGRRLGREFELAGILRPELETGVEGGAVLIAFANALLGTDLARLNRARLALETTLGADAVVAAAAIAANFSKNDRIANAIGIPMDPQFLKGSEDFRERLGINGFRSARNTLK